jgi:citrate synthase
MVDITLRVNGATCTGSPEARKTLADFLRDDLGLTGTHLGCEHGVCGACTVIVDGRAVRSCLMLAVQAAGSEVTTIEGLAMKGAGEAGGGLGTLQQAMWDSHSFQCGFCTPGMVMQAAAFLSDHPDAGEQQIREALSGNICRCTGYQSIVDGVLLAAERGASPGPAAPPHYPTSLGTSDATTITLLGQDLAADLMGKVGFGELALWLVTQQRPTPSQVRVFEAVLVALADHGFTPTAIAARLTYLSAPDSVQGALAAGLLGGGSRFLGVTEDAGRFLAETLAGAGQLPEDEAGWDALALTAVQRARADGRLIPGLGHPVHKVTDPRTPVLFEIAAQEGTFGPHLRLFEAIGRVHAQVLGRTLPLNGAGTCGAALADLGLPPDLLRGFALLARAAGLLGQLAEEMRRPLGMDMYLAVDRNAVYQPPGS